MKTLFNNLFFEPLYNALIYIIDIFSWADLGIAVIILTVIVKLILFPLSKKSVRTQIEMRRLQKPMEELKKKYKDDRAMLGQKTLELYRENKVNPFASILLILIQLPIILALFFVFAQSGLPVVNPDLLYDFVEAPSHIGTTFLGFVDLAEKSLWLAILAGLTQHFQARFSFPKEDEIKIDKNKKRSFQEDLQRGMGVQVKYVLPVIIVFVAYTFVSVVALYWIISNIFATGQEIYIRNKIKRPADAEDKKREKEMKENTPVISES